MTDLVPASAVSVYSVITPVIWVLVHPIDRSKHPTVPPGWRWAVMVGDGPAHDLDRAANAGWCPTKQEAITEGDQNAATAVRALHIVGAAVGYRQPPMVIDRDPIPADGDRIHTI